MFIQMFQGWQQNVDITLEVFRDFSGLPYLASDSPLGKPQ